MRRLLAAARFFSLLSFTIWLGGLALIGLAAPAIFGVNRALGPYAVAAILGRFGPVTVVCGVLLVLCWLAERRSSPFSSTRAMNVQGVLTAGMVALGLYLALVLTPRIENLQPRLEQRHLAAAQVPEFTSATRKAEFRRAHRLYGALTSVVVLLGVSVLGIVAARGAHNEYANLN